ncbi:histidine kinase [Streptomyces ruber]|uniref:Histidine kinase n=2 Tax=Streptomyces TaxID=1883 RepID=A0A918BML8_9ACTN|nr:VCBS repeat-containing protein [Streptomyces ruber]GGQ77731.1 histidine kinase [Streptomyces ruber]
MRGRSAGRAGVRGTAALAIGVLGLGLAACGPAERTSTTAKKPEPVARATQGHAQVPVPRGEGDGDVPDDFNGDGRRDLVLNDLVKSESHADDAGIGIVYGTEDGLDPGARQLLSPAEQAAPTDGVLPAVFEAEESCDLDGDGFTDLVVSTDPPYDGQGQPPVPLQLLFGSPAGLTGRAVTLDVPARARAGNDWPDQPVCGDFDGDGADDLVLHASASRLTYLRGPFTRDGAPRAADAPLAAPGSVPTGPAVDVNGDGYDDLLVREDGDASPSSVVYGGPSGPARTGFALPAGVDVAFGSFGGERDVLDAAVGSQDGTALRYDLTGPTVTTQAALDVPGTVLDAGDLDGDGYAELVTGGTELRVFQGRTKGLTASGVVTVDPPAEGTTRVLAVGDFTGDGLADLAVRTYRGETEDTVAVYAGRREGVVDPAPVVTFSTAEFLVS